MLTERAKFLLGAVIVVGIISGFGYTTYIQQKEINAIFHKEPLIITKTVIMTPTVIPTATPEASLRTRIYTPAKASNITVTKGTTK